jgi:hypothetical protein
MTIARGIAARVAPLCVCVLPLSVCLVVIHMLVHHVFIAQGRIRGTFTVFFPDPSLRY